MLECSVLYGRIVILAVPFYMLQNLFQSFFITAEKPKLGLFVIVLAGVANMVLDFLLVAVVPLGLAGAAIATSISQLLGGIVPLFYFFRKNDSLLRLGRPHFYGKILVKTCTNGSSELMSNISMSVVTILYNHQLMKYAGDNGVAAYGVIMYVGFVIVAIFIGYSMGSAPLISFNFGAENKAEMKNIFKKSGVIIGLSSISLAVISFVFATPLSAIFVGYDKALLGMTVKGFKIYSFSFLFCGVSIFGSSFFTALNNGVISAIISFLRTFVFQIAGVLILPPLFESGIDGIWYSIIVAEALSFVITVAMITANKKKYGYT
jgi:Na+-driven multidrug efflux pump